MLNGFWRNFISELFTVLGLSAKKSHGTDLHLNEWDGVFLYGHYIVLQERKVVQNAFPWPANLRQLFHLNFSPFYFTNCFHIWLGEMTECSRCNKYRSRFFLLQLWSVFCKVYNKLSHEQHHFVRHLFDAWHSKWTSFSGRFAILLCHMFQFGT